MGFGARLKRALLKRLDPFSAYPRAKEERRMLPLGRDENDLRRRVVRFAAHHSGGIVTEIGSEDRYGPSV